MSDFSGVVVAPGTAAALAGKVEEAKVDCAGCTACCRHDAVLLVEGDDPALYPEAQEIPFNLLTGEPGLMIPHKADGSCIYLGERGCTVYDHRPVMCRVFSCVGFVESVLQQTTRAERRADLASGALPQDVWKAGKMRLQAAAPINPNRTEVSHG